MELEATLKVFIPEYIPAVGEVDAYLKMPRPDGEQEQLGLYQMDEPALNQSKKAKLDLMMNEFMKKKKMAKIRSFTPSKTLKKIQKKLLAGLMM
jgi:intraflagellar transport protein 46